MPRDAPRRNESKDAWPSPWGRTWRLPLTYAIGEASWPSIASVGARRSGEARDARGERARKKKDVEQRRGRDLSGNASSVDATFRRPASPPAMTRHAGILEPPRKSWHLLNLVNDF